MAPSGSSPSLARMDELDIARVVAQHDELHLLLQPEHVGEPESVTRWPILLGRSRDEGAFYHDNRFLTVSTTVVTR